MIFLANTINTSFAFIFILILTLPKNLHSQSNFSAYEKQANISQTRIKQLVTDYIRERLARNVERYTVEFIHLPSDIATPIVEIENVNSLVLRGKVTFNLLVKTGENRQSPYAQRRLPISVLIRTYETALVTTSLIDRHQEVTAAMVRPEVVETTNAPAPPIREISGLHGLRTRGIIPAGRVLHAGLLEPMPLIHRGDPVTIVVRMNGVTAKTMGKSMQDGGINEMIRVQNVSTKKILNCIIEDKNTVRVQ